MPVKIAGYNIDADLIDIIKTLFEEIKSNRELINIKFSSEIEALMEEDNLTPETLSAAYARISRDPNQVSELRKIARQSVARARRSNAKIVFEYGHHSVAEHAVVNLDVTGISRLAVETIESRRLMSFTEKSQRYIALSREFVIPLELKSLNQGQELRSLCESLFDAYHQFLPVLSEYFRKQGHSKPELPAREDARYVLPLAAAAQLGMTGNSRNIELLIRRTNKHSLAELRDFAAELKANVEKITPSLIQFTEDSGPEIEEANAAAESNIPEEEVELLYYTADADDITTASIIFLKEGKSWKEALLSAKNMNDSEKRSLICKALQGLNSFHPLPRCYENVDFAFQAVISSAAFGQLKRHRIATQIQQNYDPRLGYTIPLSIKEAGLESDFKALMERAEGLYERIEGQFSLCAAYALTNAHRRVVFFKANARELHHLARLRMDQTAQWDIRNIVSKMMELARQQAPLTLALACGKDEFEEMSRGFFK